MRENQVFNVEKFVRHRMKKYWRTQKEKVLIDEAFQVGKLQQQPIQLRSPPRMMMFCPSELI